MWVYIVFMASVYHDVIDKVFTSKHKAEDYIKEQSNLHPSFQYRIEEYFAT